MKGEPEDVEVRCSESELGHEHTSFGQMLDSMERSIFCLVLPGDAQSTRRLSEIFMAGCIPVFVGPPYNTMPLAEDVLYASVGVFFNVSAYAYWLPVVSFFPLHSLYTNSSFCPHYILIHISYCNQFMTLS